jgi:hypothetical protein
MICAVTTHGLLILSDRTSLSEKPTSAGSINEPLLSRMVCALWTGHPRGAEGGNKHQTDP